MLTIIGENLHCSRIFKRGGPRCRVDGGAVRVLWQDGPAAAATATSGRPGSFAVPAAYDGDKVRHIAAALAAAMTASDQEALAYLRHVVRRQESAGAGVIDVNVDEFSSSPERNREAMSFLLAQVLGWTSLPLAIDSSSAATLATGARALHAAGRPFILNSASVERPQVLDLAAEHGGGAVVSAAGGQLPNSAADRLDALRPLLKQALAAGLPMPALYLDPLVLPVAVDGGHGRGFLDACRMLREECGPEVHITGGISNVSFGLPERQLLNVRFLQLAEARGLDAPIFDPRQLPLPPDTPAAFLEAAEKVLLGEDDFAMNFLTVVRQ
ncbi:MAG: dihydropteroate synthase [Lentisphaeria bacterium]|jgi:5-methyltetrahydrofolate--homocysteine methyltransferase|nr:dihydropteroate synthase [Lentisphaeria bacterium]